MLGIKICVICVQDNCLNVCTISPTLVPDLGTPTLVSLSCKSSVCVSSQLFSSLLTVAISHLCHSPKVPTYSTSSSLLQMISSSISQRVKKNKLNTHRQVSVSITPFFSTFLCLDPVLFQLFQKFHFIFCLSQGLYFCLITVSFSLIY